VRVTAGEASASAPVTVLPDPRSAATEEELATWIATQTRIAAMLEEVLGALDGARTARRQVEALLAAHDDAALSTWAEAAIAAIDAWEPEIVELRHETFEDEDAWAMKLDGQLRHLLDVVEDGGAPVTDGARERLGDLEAQWAALRAELARIASESLTPINGWAREQAVPHVEAPLAQ